MKNIIFIDEYSSSKYNGIGTFRDLLLKGLHSKNYNISIISLDSDSVNFEVHRNTYGYNYIFPSFINGGWRYNADSICVLLRLYINDHTDNVFIINHSPCSLFISVLKIYFPLSKLIFIVHDQGWCRLLAGNKELLIDILSKNINTAVPRYLIDLVIESFDEEKKIYNNVDAVVCLSRATFNLLKDIYKIPINKINLIHNGIPPYNNLITKTAARNKLVIPQNDILLLYVGRLAKEKGLAILLEALSELRKKIPNLKCAIIGRVSSIIYFEKLISEIASSLIFTGFINQKDINYWYSAADIGILPSYTEQCSFVALEMMRNNMRIVSSNGNGLDEMFNDNINAFMASIDENTQYTKNMIDATKHALYVDENVSSQMQQYNRNLLETKYSFQAMINLYCQLLDKLN